MQFATTNIRPFISKGARWKIVLCQTPEMMRRRSGDSQQYQIAISVLVYDETRLQVFSGETFPTVPGSARGGLPVVPDAAAGVYAEDFDSSVEISGDCQL